MNTDPRNFTQDDFDQLAALIETADDRIKALDDLRSKREYLRASLHLRMNEIRSRTLELRAAGHRVSAPPDVPAAADKWTSVPEDFAALWEQINGVAGQEFVASDGSTCEEFTWQIGEMDQFFHQIKEEREHVKKAIRARDRLGDPLRVAVAHRRVKIPRSFAPNHPLVLLLAYDAHKLKEVNEQKVILSGTWDAVQQQVSLSWKPTPRRDLQHYEVRQCSENPYDVFYERTVWSGLDAHAWIRPWFGPGATMRFRLYAVLSDHEAHGSNTVAITRPFP